MQTKNKRRHHTHTHSQRQSGKPVKLTPAILNAAGSTKHSLLCCLLFFVLFSVCLTCCSWIFCVHALGLPCIMGSPVLRKINDGGRSKCAHVSELKKSRTCIGVQRKQIVMCSTLARAPTPFKCRKLAFNVRLCPLSLFFLLIFSKSINFYELVGH